MASLTPLQTADLAKLIAGVEAQLIESRKDFNMISGVLLGQGWIVVAPAGFPLDFTVTGRVVTNPRRGQFAGRVMRMTLRDAETVALSVVDGSGDHGRAMHVRGAILVEIAERKDLLAALQRAAAEHEQGGAC